MRKLILYIAASLDGYIARENGDVDWLPTEGDHGYKQFYDSIETTLMGNNTYKQVLTFGEFPYKKKKNYVFTRDIQVSMGEFVEFINQKIEDFITELKKQDGKDIWLIGGSQIIDICIINTLIDEFFLFIVPIILGNGIPLFTVKNPEIKLNILDSNIYESGIVGLHYKF